MKSASFDESEVGVSSCECKATAAWAGASVGAGAGVRKCKRDGTRTRRCGGGRVSISCASVGECLYASVGGRSVSACRCGWKRS